MRLNGGALVRAYHEQYFTSVPDSHEHSDNSVTGERVRTIRRNLRRNGKVLEVFGSSLLACGLVLLFSLGLEASLAFVVTISFLFAVGDW